MALPADADPGRKAYSRKHTLLKQGWTLDRIKAEEPETHRLAREWENRRRRERWAENRERRPDVGFMHKMTWREITDEVNTYNRWRKGWTQGLDKGEVAVLREFVAYRRRVQIADMRKRKAHPELRPEHLGWDPRTRNWPSGKIQVADTYIERPGNRSVERKLRVAAKKKELGCA